MPKIPSYGGKPDEDETETSPDEKGSGAVVTLPKSILMGKPVEVGDTVSLKITAIRDGEVDVESGSSEEEVAEPDTEEDTGEEGMVEEGGDAGAEPAAGAGPVRPPAYR